MSHLPPVHPGEILRQDVLAETGQSAAAVARALGIGRARLSQILRGERGITADTALRLARWLGTSAQFWLNLQAQYDLALAEQVAGERISREVTPLRAA